MAVAHIRLVIKDFSFMRVTEVDPVNYSAVIGAAGGAWRKFGSRYETCTDHMSVAEGAKPVWIWDTIVRASCCVFGVFRLPGCFFSVFLMHRNFCSLQVVYLCRWRCLVDAHREPEMVGAISSYVDIVTPSAHCTPFFPPAEILCIVFGLLFVLDHKVPPQKVRRRRKKTKKRKATGPSSASGQPAVGLPPAQDGVVCASRGGSPFCAEPMSSSCPRDGFLSELQ